MQRTARFILITSLLLGLRAAAADLEFTVRSVVAPSWQARDVRLQLLPPHAIQLDIGSITAAGAPPMKHFSARCRELEAGHGARCDHAAFGVEVQGLGKLEGTLQARYDNALHWHAELEIPKRGFRIVAEQAGFALTATLHARSLDFSEPTGRYAAEKLAADITLKLAGNQWDLNIDAHGGQAYAEPMFFDFAALPLQLQARLTPLGDGWRIEQLHAVQGKAGTLEASGTIGKDYQPRELDAHLVARDLGALVAADSQPFLIGGKFDGATASGGADATLVVRAGAPVSIAATLDHAGFDASKLGVALEGLQGKINWTAADGAAPSQLSWTGGALQKIPLGASSISFRTQARTLELLADWSQPLLEGALKVKRLALRDLGSAQLDADFEGELEPLNLAALCKALGWPEFPGTLGGRLPGLTVRDDVWSVDGALEAQAFDGEVRIDHLRALQPFGVLPRVMADINLRKLDLERVTSAYSFGRITGRLDGDITGLRLLNWSPVQFDGRIFSTQGDSGSRRISQRAIDSISSIGGGPTGVLSRGFLRVFQDFAYDKLGMSCVLRDGVCQMDGVEPAPAKGDVKAYYLVKGRLLPRIDVVGYAQRVSWSSLLAQVKAARESQGPQLGEQKK